MGPDRNSSLPIEGDPFAVSGSGQTGGSSDCLTRVVPRNAPREPPFPWTRVRGELTRLNTPGGRNI